MFIKASTWEAQTLRNILDSYATASGQVINYEKSSLTYSQNVNEDLRSWMGNILGIRNQGVSGNYLGLPSLVGRNKKEILGYIKRRMTTRMRSWNNKFLTKAGNEIMLKSVIQSIPTYAMGVFLLPKGLVSDIERKMNAF